MRTMLKITIPVEAGNNSIKDGSLPKIMGEALERLKPEAAYFLAENGLRTALLVIDLKDPSDIPSISEPFFLGFNAGISATPCMNADDLKAGLQKLQGAK
jgi:hypothetical protein